MTRLRVALGQINPVVGDLAGNAERIIAALEVAEEAGADVAVFPELAITGYPPEDLLLKPGFVADNLAALSKVAAATDRCVAVVGFVDEQLDLYNAAAVCAAGEVRGVYHKQELPNYGVFDEQRYFAPGRGATQLFGIGGVRVGVSICEDAWNPQGPIAAQAAAGAELVININASPYYLDRLIEREQMLATRAADASCGLVYLNCVGGQDELVFDGASLVFDAAGRLVASLPAVRRRAGRGRPRRPPGLPQAAARPPRPSLGRRRCRCPRSPPSPDRPGRPPPAGAEGGPAADRGRGLPGAGHRHPGLRQEKRVQRRGHRSVGRDRLVAGGRGGRRRPRSRARARRLHAVPLLERGRVLRRRRVWPPTSASTYRTVADRSRPTPPFSTCWHPTSRACPPG